jgi:hypothetical protein
MVVLLLGCAVGDGSPPVVAPSGASAVVRW